MKIEIKDMPADGLSNDKQDRYLYFTSIRSMPTLEW